MGSTFFQCHLGHGWQCLLWTRPSGILQQHPMSVSAEPPWDDVAREAQLSSLDSTALGSTLLDTASRVHQCLPRTEPVLYIQHDPGACPGHAQQPPMPSADRTSRQGLSDPDRGLQGSSRCPPGPLWRSAQALPGRPAVYPRSRQQGAPFRLGSCGRGGRRCAAPCCAPARTGPGPLDAASPLLLPAGRAPAAGECGAAEVAAL